MTKPRPPTKQSPGVPSAKNSHRDQEQEAVDCNCLEPHHTKIPVGFQTESSDRAIKQLMAHAIIRLNEDKARSEKHLAILQELEILLTAWSELE